jgi:hypothetical protein
MFDDRGVESSAARRSRGLFDVSGGEPDRGVFPEAPRASVRDLSPEVGVVEGG